MFFQVRAHTYADYRKRTDGSGVTLTQLAASADGDRRDHCSHVFSAAVQLDFVSNGSGDPTDSRMRAQGGQATAATNVLRRVNETVQEKRNSRSAASAIITEHMRVRADITSARAHARIACTFSQPPRPNLKIKKKKEKKCTNRVKNRVCGSTEANGAELKRTLLFLINLQLIIE